MAPLVVCSLTLVLLAYVALVCAGVRDGHAHDLAAETGKKGFSVTLFKDAVCAQWRGHVEVAEKQCVMLAWEPLGLVSQVKNLGQVFGWATVKEGRLLLCDSRECTACFAPQEHLRKAGAECHEVASDHPVGAYVAGLKFSKPEISLQYHQQSPAKDNACAKWEDRSREHIWQQDLPAFACFETMVVLREKRPYGIFMHVDGVTSLYVCSDKACKHDCLPFELKQDQCQRFFPEEKSLAGGAYQVRGLRFSTYKASASPGVSATLREASHCPEHAAQVQAAHRKVEETLEAVSVAVQLKRACPTLLEDARRLQAALEKLQKRAALLSASSGGKSLLELEPLAAAGDSVDGEP